MNYSNLRSQILAAIKYPPKISAASLQEQLINIVNGLDLGALLLGVATPSLTPNTEANVFYFALQSGTYTNFPTINGQTITVDSSEVAIIVRSGNYWSKIHITTYPTIDPTTKHWMIGNEDTGVLAEGTTPHIDQETGNWFIGTHDTGVHAQGAQGAPGKDAYQPFKGTFDSVQDLNAAYPNPNDGDTAYVSVTVDSTTELHVYDVENGAWHDTGTTADSPVFGSGQLLSSMKIDDTHLVNPSDGALPKAEDVISFGKNNFIQLGTSPFLYTKNEFSREYLVSNPLSYFATDSTSPAYGSASTSKHGILPVREGDIVEIHASENNSTYYAFLFDQDHPASEKRLPLVADTAITRVYSKEVATVTIPNDCKFLYYALGATSGGYLSCPAKIVVYTKVVNGDIEKEEDTYEGANLLDPDKVRLYWALAATDGYIARTTSSTKGVTDYIEVRGGDIYARNPVTVGTTNAQGCVYDINKTFIRSFSGGLYTYQEGDYYVRYTVDMSVTLSNRVIIRGNALSRYSGIEWLKPLNQTELTGVILNEDGVPFARPARGATGVGLLSNFAVSLADGSLTTGSSNINTVRPMSNISATMGITSFNSVEIGQGRSSSNGWAVKITNTNVILGRYDSAFISQDTKAHNLTISTYLNVSLIRNGSKVKIRLMTLTGECVIDLDSTGTSYNHDERYGMAFIYADATTSLFDVNIKHTPIGLKKPVWFAGASYMALYEKRLTYQLINTYGVDNFSVIGVPGYSSDQIFNIFKNALKYGCPRYVVWGPGMNDESPYLHRVYLLEAMKLCKEYGIDFIPCKIPYMESQSTHSITKDNGEINSNIEMFCNRWIDLFAAVSADSEGHWYEGYNDDNTHPTVLGAKAMASRVLTDFPEILNVV